MYTPVQLTAMMTSFLGSEGPENLKAYIKQLSGITLI